MSMFAATWAASLFVTHCYLSRAAWAMLLGYLWISCIQCMGCLLLGHMWTCVHVTATWAANLPVVSACEFSVHVAVGQCFPGQCCLWDVLLGHCYLGSEFTCIQCCEHSVHVTVGQCCMGVFRLPVFKARVMFAVWATCEPVCILLLLLLGQRICLHSLQVAIQCM